MASTCLHSCTGTVDVDLHNAHIHCRGFGRVLGSHQESLRRLVIAVLTHLSCAATSLFWATPTAPSILPSTSRCNGACNEKLSTPWTCCSTWRRWPWCCWCRPATLMVEPGALDAAAALAREEPSFVWMLIGNSSLAYLVLRNANGAVAVVVSILIFKNSVTAMGMLGYGLRVTIAGVVLYGEAKKRSK
ncbi:hypothetical protein ZWY2020_034481 [Hordeum vulgare]|nr:hypothetical protein ZWY2020_034481 [Hordeum vulgare]